jgi:hypothetical protein
VSGNPNGRRSGVPKGNREVRTTTPPLQTRLALELYSYRQLSRMWHRSVSTIQDWVSTARREGLLIYGTYRLDAHHRRREFYIRGDSAAALYRRFLSVRVTPYKPRRWGRARRATMRPWPP